MDQYEGTGRTTNDQRSPSLPRRRRAARWLAGASLLLGFACSGPGDEFGDLGEADQDLLVSNYTTLWNGNQLGKGADISVCFAVAPQTFRNGDGSERVDCVNETNSSLDCLGQAIPGGTAAMRRHVRTYIENAWQRYADVHLNGWGDCAIDAATGTHKVENIQGVMIRFSHYVGDPVDWSGVGKSGSGATVIQYNAPALYHDGKYDDDLGNLVHEFGHALGFDHEWLRADWPYEAFCDQLSNQAVRFSAFPGKCLDVSNSGTADGTKIQVWTCNNTNAQQWTQPGDGTLRAMGKCLDVSNSGTTNGTRVQLWGCNGTGAQVWEPWANGALRNPQSGKCLQTENSGSGDGTGVQIWDCNGSNAQRFGKDEVVPGNTLGTAADAASIMQYCIDGGMTIALTPWDVLGLQKAYGRHASGSLVGYRGQCADVYGASSTDGASIAAYPCHGQWWDKWSRSNSSYEQFVTKPSSTTTRCLKVKNGTAPNPLVSAACSATTAQRFTTTGMEWRAMGNLCVEATGTSAGSKLRVATCAGTARQKWDFHDIVGGRTGKQIELSGTSKCVAGTTSSGALGQELVLATCSTTDTKQQFTYPGSGVVAYANNTGYCANVSGGNPTPGSAVILWDGCSASGPVRNAQFTIKGKIKVLNHCMTLRDTGGTNDIVAADACSASNTTTQLWEYYL